MFSLAGKKLQSVNSLSKTKFTSDRKLGITGFKFLLYAISKSNLNHLTLVWDNSVQYLENTHIKINII